MEDEVKPKKAFQVENSNFSTLDESIFQREIEKKN
jgi:hypothetical protein